MAARLPRALVEALGLKPRNEIDAQIRGSQTADVDSDQVERRRLLKQLRKYRGMMPAGFKFDRDEANRR